MRVYYKQIQEGKTSHSPLSQDQIGRLERLGFGWRRTTTFEEKFVELAVFKAKHGHCNVQHSPASSEYISLGIWCGHVRASFKKIQEGKTPHRPLSHDQIGRVERLRKQTSL